MLQILILCTANICRSPAAQAFLGRLLVEDQVRVDSAGTLAINGNAADPVIRRLMEARGYPEVEAHRSRVLMPHHVTQYELILCMESAHIDFVRRLSPVSVGKSMLLGHWSKSREVSDPIGQSDDVYTTSLDEIQQLCRQWASKMTAMGLVK